MLLLPEQTVAPPSPNSEAPVVKNSSAPLLPNHSEDSSEAVCPTLGASLQTSKTPFTSVLAAGVQVKCQLLSPGRPLVLPAWGDHSLLWDGNAIVGYRSLHFRAGPRGVPSHDNSWQELIQDL